jgi:alkaline phosphatase
MTYVDGFVMPVKKSDLAKYRKAANLGKRVWMESGALDYKECVVDDLNMLVPDETGRGTKRIPSLFPRMVKAKPGETIIFSFIVYRSKAHRIAVNKKVFANPNMADFDPADMPVDMKRMATAGFKTIVEASAKGRRPRTARPRNGTRSRTVAREPEVVWSR